MQHKSHITGCGNKVDNGVEERNEMRRRSNSLCYITPTPLIAIRCFPVAPRHLPHANSNACHAWSPKEHSIASHPSLRSSPRYRFRLCWHTSCAASCPGLLQNWKEVYIQGVFATDAAALNWKRQPRLRPMTRRKGSSVPLKKKKNRQ